MTLNQPQDCNGLLVKMPEAEKITGLHRMTLMRAVGEGRLKRFRPTSKTRLWLFRRSDLYEFAEKY